MRPSRCFSVIPALIWLTGCAHSATPTVGGPAAPFRYPCTINEFDSRAITSPQRSFGSFGFSPDWKVYLDGKRVMVRPVAEEDKFCGDHPPFDGHWYGDVHTLRVSDGWLIAENIGEFGAFLRWYSPDGKQERELSSENVNEFISVGKTVYAVGGLAHLGMNEGSVLRISQDSSGAWKAESFATLPGAGCAAVATKDGGLIVVCQGSIVKVSPTGQVSPLAVKERFYYPNSMVLSTDQVLYVGERFGVAEIRGWDRQPRVRELDRVSFNRQGRELDRQTLIPTLERELLKDADVKVRITAANILGRTDPTSVPALTAALDDPDPSVQAEALDSLSHLKDLSKPATQSVLRLMKSGNEEVRWRAISACAWIQIEHDQAVPLLLAATKDASSIIRFRAVESLGRLKVASPEVLAALVQGLDDDDWNVMNDSSEALANIGEPAVPALIDATRHANAAARRYAASALLSIGPKAKAAIPALEAMNKDPDMEAGAMAARALRAIKGLPEPEHNGGRVTFPRN